MSWPSIDHGVLSPSGHVSKRAERAAKARNTAVLFPAEYWDKPAKSDAELRAELATALRRQADTLRGLAARGMSPRKHLKVATDLEKQADELTERHQPNPAEV